MEQNTTEDISEFYPSDEIYEVSFGRDPMTDYRFTVGHSRVIDGQEVTIAEIVDNVNAFITHGATRTEIHVKKKKNGDVKMWKVSENQPRMLTYKI